MNWEMMERINDLTSKKQRLNDAGTLTRFTNRNAKKKAEEAVMKEMLAMDTALMTAKRKKQIRQEELKKEQLRTAKERLFWIFAISFLAGVEFCCLIGF